MKIYLDNCCFNRPYDDQTQIRISLETQAKLYVQGLVRERKVELVTSYVLWYENSQNPYETKRTAIEEFIQKNSTKYINIDKADFIKKEAEGIYGHRNQNERCLSCVLCYLCIL